ncbi:gamma-glutamyltranspeptidase/glutathione hydrolase [Eilatimonas milleporae]|uniref:Glutathione hydrolase proenzyme n=2 Tax=Eilatimonas milleporae TaxID=911205 RepID=A0A3M0CHL0_9PROT|nr:gamma-glutamyltransferase [Eilatimonas milleporae]RMB08020.1 gamma-glutamyltranspeptidase/glutathione hydrolase [Eilatimonas milleporae]
MRRIFTPVKAFCTFTLMTLTAFFTLFTAFNGAVAQPAAREGALISYRSAQHPVLAENGMVVSQDGFASQAGLEVLRAGGNAIDAAVATGFALAVTHPQAGNLGGGGFLLAYIAAEDRVIALDYREMAPKGASRDMFLGDDGAVDNDRARFSYLSSGVPGTVMGLLRALDAYGTLPRATVMAPAIRLAEDGFAMTWPLYESLSRYQKRLKSDAASAAYFFKPDGSAYKPGEVFRQPDLAKTLKTIAGSGADGFYKGWVADAIVETMGRNGGLITHGDLASYVAKERTPVSGTFRDFRVVSMPPPSSGGVHIVQMLNVLEGWDLAGLGHNSAAYLHRLAETMKYAYADRSKYLGDPDFTPVPVAALTDKDYAARIRARIDVDKATPSTEIGPAPTLADESPDTTHYSTADRWGNMVANTYTLNFTYGNGKSVAGAGFLLNNEMDDFSAKPGVPNAFGLLGGEANAIAPGKRPLSSMTPTLLFRDGRPFMATGAPGGSRIITAVLQVILNATAFDMNAMEAVAAPRIHHQWFPDRLFMEPGHSVDTRALLAAMGQAVKADPRDGFDFVIGSTQTIVRNPDGILMGAPDPRRPGSSAAAY